MVFVIGLGPRSESGGDTTRAMTWTLLVVNGPNLNLLGEREPEVYGAATLDEIIGDLAAYGAERGAAVEHFQSNVEGELVDALHRARGSADGIVLNPGAFSHYSIALRDAIAAIDLPVVEAHLSNVHAREDFRRTSVLAPVCLGVIAGFGAASYRLAVDALVGHLEGRSVEG